MFKRQRLSQLNQMRALCNRTRGKRRCPALEGDISRPGRAFSFSGLHRLTNSEERLPSLSVPPMGSRGKDSLPKNGGGAIILSEADMGMSGKAEWDLRSAARDLPHRSNNRRKSSFRLRKRKLKLVENMRFRLYAPFERKVII